MKCLCKLDIQVTEFHDLCPVHKLADRKNYFHALALDRLATIERQEVQLHSNKVTLDDAEASFQLRHAADMRAIKRWQESTGRTEVWPDHTDLVVWLMDQLEVSEPQATIRKLRSERDEIMSALGEHLDSPVHIATRIGQIRDEGRGYFHKLTELVHKLDAIKQILKPAPKLPVQPLALACTKCGSTIHTDSFHSERCPNGYR